MKRPAAAMAQTLGKLAKAETGLPKVRLGRTGLMVSVPALGGVGLGPIYGDTSEEDAIATVQRAVARGINFIDTSPLYRESEARIGLALQTLSKKQREGLIICSKVGDECPPWSDNGGHHAMSKAGVLCSVANSLKNLGVAKLDVVLLHDPTMEDVKRFLGPGGGMEALLQLRDEGKVGYFGIGSVDQEQILDFMKSPRTDCSVYLSVNDNNLVRRYAATGDVVSGSPLRYGPSPYAEAQWRDIGVLNAGIYYMGLLADPENAWSTGFRKDFLIKYPKIVDLARRIQIWCEKEMPEERGIKPIPIRTLALQYGLRHEAVSSTIVGCRSAREVDEVCDAYMECIEKAVWTEFDAKFGMEIQSLDWQADHWRYSKESSDIG